MSIAYVPHEAACDGRLTKHALSLLLYLSGENVHPGKWDGYWSWESLSEIAAFMSDPFYNYSPKMIRLARRLLLHCGYLERTFRLILSEDGTHIRKRQFCYRVVVCMDDPVSLVKRA